jgi:hypothetical protein
MNSRPYFRRLLVDGDTLAGIRYVSLSGKTFVVATQGKPLAGCQLNQLSHLRSRDVLDRRDHFHNQPDALGSSYWLNPSPVLARIQADSTFGPFDIAGAGRYTNRSIARDDCGRCGSRCCFARFESRRPRDAWRSLGLSHWPSST